MASLIKLQKPQQNNGSDIVFARPPANPRPDEALRHMAHLSYTQAKILMRQNANLAHIRVLLIDIDRRLERLERDRRYWSRVRMQFDILFWISAVVFPIVTGAAIVLVAALLSLI